MSRLSFIRDADGELIAKEGAEASSAQSAMSRARSMSGQRAESIAFSWDRRSQLGEFYDAVILEQCGEVPADPMSFTSSR